MIFIFCMSHKTAEVSSEMSNSIIDIIIEYIPQEVVTALTEPNSTFNIDMSYIVRKAAHMFEYFVLYILLYFGFYKVQKANYIYPFLIAFLYACSDEFHQLFIPGRAGMFTDVLIDSIGITVALTLILIINKIKSKKHLNL